MRLLFRPSRLLSPLTPATVGGLLGLCALDPVAGVSLAGQLRRWPDWGDGDVVAMGGAGRPAAGAWATGSLLPFGLAARPGTGHTGASPGETGAVHPQDRLPGPSTAPPRTSSPCGQRSPSWAR